MTARRTRGHSVGMTREAVLRAALALVDREGLKALSMRRLGAELDVEAMTIYHHVPNKDALLDGLVEQLVASIAPPVFGTPWQDGIREYAQDLRAALLAHPNLVPLIASRPAITAQNLQALEAALEGLRSAGLAPADALDVIYAVTGFVVGHLVTTADGDPVDQLAPLDLSGFPLLAEAAKGSRDAEARFVFALDALVSGLGSTR